MMQALATGFWIWIGALLCFLVGLFVAAAMFNGRRADEVTERAVSMKHVPSPGSVDAVLIGCVCPPATNGDGRGYGHDPQGRRLYVISADCSIHGTQYRTPASFS